MQYVIADAAAAAAAAAADGDDVSDDKLDATFVTVGLRAWLVAVALRPAAGQAPPTCTRC